MELQVLCAHCNQPIRRDCNHGWRHIGSGLVSCETSPGRAFMAKPATPPPDPQNLNDWPKAGEEGKP